MASKEFDLPHRSAYKEIKAYFASLFFDGGFFATSTVLHWQAKFEGFGPDHIYGKVQISGFTFVPSVDFSMKYFYCLISLDHRKSFSDQCVYACVSDSALSSVILNYLKKIRNFEHAAISLQSFKQIERFQNLDRVLCLIAPNISRIQLLLINYLRYSKNRKKVICKPTLR